MKKLLSLCLTAILCLCCLASCGSAHKENEWFSEEKLTKCLVGDLPTIEKDYVNSGGEDIYVSFTAGERESYIAEVFEYLKSQNFKYLGTRGEQASTLAGSFTTYYFKPATELSEFYVGSSYKFVYSDGTLDEGGDPIFCILTIYDYEAKNLEYGTKNFAYNTLITLRYKSEAPLSGRYALNEEEHEHTITYVSAGESGHFENYTCGCPHDHGAVPHYDDNIDLICDACGYVMPEHEHTGKWYKNETIHVYEYTCGCENNDIAEHHVYGDDNGSCVICGYVIGGTATNTGKVQTKISEDASLPQFMSLEVDKHNALSNGSTISVDVYMGYDILNKDGAAFSDIIVPKSDFGKYTFVLEVNYNNEERVIVLDSVNYFEEYRCDIYQDVVQYSKYNTVQLDTTKIAGKSYGFVNLELIMLSDTNERYCVSAETLYYSVTDTEIIFGLVSNPVATEGDPGIITNGWVYQETTP